MEVVGRGGDGKIEVGEEDCKSGESLVVGGAFIR